MSGGFAILRASQPLPSAQLARGAPSLESEARRRRRAKELGLEPNEAPMGQREAIRLSEARQLSAEQRGEQRQLEAEARSEERQIAGEGRAQKRSLEIEAERSKASQAKLDAKTQKELEKRNAERSLVALPPISEQQPSLTVDPKEMEAIRQQQGWPEESAQLAGKPTLATAAQQPIVQLDDEVRGAFDAGTITLERAMAIQRTRDAQRAKQQAEEAKQQKIERAEQQDVSQLMATAADLRPAASRDELDKMVATARARGMTAPQLASELQMERKEMDALAAKERKTREEADRLQAQYGSAIKSVFPDISDEDMKERLEEATEGRVTPSTLESRLLREKADRKIAMKTAKARSVTALVDRAVKAWNDGDDSIKDAIMRQIREDLVDGDDEAKIAATKVLQKIRKIAELPE
jgi:hypothetical protein